MFQKNKNKITTIHIDISFVFFLQVRMVQGVLFGSFYFSVVVYVLEHSWLTEIMKSAVKVVWKWRFPERSSSLELYIVIITNQEPNNLSTIIISTFQTITCWWSHLNYLVHQYLFVESWPPYFNG